jgi:hypothetical protein
MKKAMKSTTIVAMHFLEDRVLCSTSSVHALAWPAVSRASDQTIPVPAHRRDLATTGRNRFFILQPGYTTVYAGNEDGQHKRLTITVLKKTRVIDGIRTRIVIERQTSNGHIEEISQNYFAIDTRTLNVYYFGEDVNIYNHGVAVSHESAWRSGVNGAKFGLAMPGDATLGRQFEQERAPGVAQDMAEIVETGIRAHVAAGTFKGSIKTRETSPLEPGNEEFKLYAPGVGLVLDDTLELIQRSFT